jgi:uncharacterized membrane protein required for colicin V production
VIDLLALAVLAVFVLIGTRRGTLASFFRLAGPLLAYAAAFWGAPHVGPFIATRLQLPTPLGVAFGGMLLFVLTLLLFGVATPAIRAALGRQRTVEPRSRLDRAGGAALGAVQGAVIVLLLGLLVSFLEALRMAGGGTLVAKGGPETDSSRLVALTQSLVEKGATAALGDSGPSSRMTTEFLAHPAETVERFQKVFGNPHIEALQSDRLFWSQVEHGALDRALNRPSFLGVAYDDTLRTDLAGLGIVSEAAKTDSRLFRNSARDVLEEVGPRVRHMKDDPAFQELAKDPEVQAALASGDTLQLLRHPQFRALVNRALDES